MNNLSSMTVREKIGQLFMVGFEGTSVSAELASFIKEYKPGGVILFKRNLASTDQIVELTNSLQACSPHSPLLVSIDQEGGRVSRLPAEFTIFPPCETLGRVNSHELAYAAAAAVATELRAVGINMNMAPVLDVNSNPDNPIIGDRAFGPTPDVVCELGGATLAGLQDNRVVACGKHFPGHGDTKADSHKELPVVTAPPERLNEIELPPFRHAIARGLSSIMTAHVLYQSLDARHPATLSSPIINDLLRRDLRFEGLVLTDDLEMHAIVDHYGIGDAAVRALLAGCDVLLICQDRDRQVAAIGALEAAIKDETITRARLDVSVARVARLKQRFLTPYKPSTVSDARLIVGCRTHKALLSSLLAAHQRLETASV